jgi:hypothetical protein
LRRLFIWTGILTTAAVSVSGQRVPPPAYRNDPRLALLRNFFRAFRSPVSHLAPDFLAAADRHGLDWRLLPSISVVESGGGKNATKNNIFGWASARRGFTSVRGSIDWVASRLAHSKLYQDKDLDAILATYNPRADYPARVKSVMKLIAPDQTVGALCSLRALINPANGPRQPALPAPVP